MQIKMLLGKIVIIFAFILLFTLFRIEAESELIFLGFIVLQNKLKPETTPIIHELKRASVRPVMITGIIF